MPTIAPLAMDQVSKTASQLEAAGDSADVPVTPLGREARSMQTAGKAPTALRENLEPWDRFERARATESAMPSESAVTSFFDLSSNNDNGRFRVHDARGFSPVSGRTSLLSHARVLTSYLAAAR